MTDIALLAIPLAFIIVSGATCWFLATAKGKWPVKLLLSIAIPAFGLVVWRAIPSYTGWPSSQPPAAKAQLLWAVVREPPPQQKGGYVYLWVLPMAEDADGTGLLKYKDIRGKPRAHVFPYTRQRHEMAETALRMIKEGKKVVVEMVEPGEERIPPPDGDVGEGDDRPSNRQLTDQYPDFRVYELPAPSFPEKEK